MIGAVSILHQTDEQLERYALGRLPEPLSAEVEEHLLVCSDCQERVDDLEAYALAMRQAISSEPEQRPNWFARIQSWFQGSSLMTPVIACAGGVAAILLAGTLYLQSPQHLLPVASLQLTATRGAMPAVEPSRETDITLADAPVGMALHAEIVDANGSKVWNGNIDHRIALTRNLAPGTYFVRLYDAGGKLLHEYGFQVRGNL